MVVDAKTLALTHVGVATVWGLIVMVMIFTVGRISGAHMNPAVTAAFTAMGAMSPKDAIAYIVAQCVGSTAAAFSIVLVLGNQFGYVGATISSVPLGSAFAIELMMTAILMFVVMGVSTGAKEESITAAIAVGSTIAMEAFVAGPLTKASMNPARSLGPALFADAKIGAFSQLWIYLTAPFIGALIGGFLYKTLKPSES